MGGRLDDRRHPRRLLLHKMNPKEGILHLRSIYIIVRTFLASRSVSRLFVQSAWTHKVGPVFSQSSLRTAEHQLWLQSDPGRLMRMTISLPLGWASSCLLLPKLAVFKIRNQDPTSVFVFFTTHKKRKKDNMKDNIWASSRIPRFIKMFSICIHIGKVLHFSVFGPD